MAHTSPHIHHINTPLWIRSRLPTRTPSIALTLILRILEYPLSLVYELYRQPRRPFPRTRLFEQMMLTLQGCTSSHTLSPLTAVYTTCTRQPSSGSPTWVSATTYLNTQVPSPGLSPIRVPSMRRSGRSFAHSPKRCEQGSRDTKRASGTPCHVPTASQPTPTVSAVHGLQ